jgi:hypothetical protein
MKQLFKILILIVGSVVLLNSCNKIEFQNISDVKLKVTFGADKSEKNTYDLTKQTPENYFVALKRVTLIGKDGTPNFEIFNESDLSSSFVFDFTDTQTTHSLMQGTTVPDGSYTSVELEIYYLQMKLQIASSTSIDDRNIRIYLSDDAETEGGEHQPGDMTQISETGAELGWLLGNGVSPDMTPISPRSDAYTVGGDGVTWLEFGGKPGNNFGPFGDLNFMDTAPHPIYITTVNFELIDNNGTEIILDFNVNDCWQFEDKDPDGAFGATDLIEDPEPTAWFMALPLMTVTLQ